MSKELDNLYKQLLEEISEGEKPQINSEALTKTESNATNNDGIERIRQEIQDEIKIGSMKINDDDFNARRNEIETFLQTLKSEIQQRELSTKDCYQMLKNYGLTQEEIEHNKSDEYLDEMYEQLNVIKNEIGNKLGISTGENLYISNSFLHIHNTNEDGYDFYKIYLSIPAEQLHECANEIFDYIAKFNIESTSKIAINDRSDNIVLRIKGKENAKIVLNFINNNQKIKNVARKTNPFLKRAGVAGISFDRYTSFNNTIAVILKLYLERKKSEDRINEISYNDFKKFIRETLVEFSEDKVIYSLMRVNSDTIWDVEKKHGYEMVNLNIEEIIKLLYYGQEETLSSNDFLDRIEFAIEKGKDSKIMYLKERAINHSDDYQKYGLQKEILNSYIKYLIENGGIEHADRKLQYFVNSGYPYGDYRSIPEEIGFRSYFMNYVSGQDIREITYGNIPRYINETAEKLRTDENHKSFYKACLIMYETRGEKYLIECFSAILKGDYSLVPKNYQQQIIDIDKNIIKEYIYSYINCTNDKTNRLQIPDDLQESLNKYNEEEKKFDDAYRKLEYICSVSNSESYSHSLRCYTMDLKSALKNAVQGDFSYFPQKHIKELENFDKELLKKCISKYIKEWWSILGEKKYDPLIEEQILGPKDEQMSGPKK